MADKRISQLIERVDIANNDVLPIVASGATTTNKVTISTIQDWMQENLDVGVTSVGITIGSTGSDVNVTGSPITTSGNITINIPTATATARGLLSPTDWSTFNNKVPYTGAITNVNLGEYGITSGFVTLDTTPTGTPASQGTIYWDDSKSTAALIMNGTTQHIGQDTFFYVKNSTGSTIAKGTCVGFAGTDGASGHLLVSPFLANGSSPSSYFMGVTAEAITNGGFGQVMQFGELSGINTSSYTAGALLYASTSVAGAFQTTAPVAPNNIILVAAAVNSTNNGSIIVRPQIGSNIKNDEGVRIVSVAEGDVLVYKSASGLWENRSLSGAGIQPVGNYVTTDTNQSITGFKSFTNGFSLASAGGTNQPSTFKNIGTIHEGSANSNQIGFNNSNNIYFGKGLNNGGVITWNNAAVRYYALPDADGTIALTSNLSSYLPLSGGTLTGALNLTNANVNLSNAYYYSGKLVSGINIALIGMNSSDKVSLDPNGYGVVVGNTLSLGGALNGTSASFTSSGGSVSISNASDIWYNLTRGSSITNIGIDATGTFYNTSTNHRFLTNSGSTTALTLASTGAATFSSSVTANELFIANSSTLANYVGAEYRYLSTLYGFSKASANDGELRHYIGPSSGWGGKITFYTDTTEKMRITSSGNVGIGTSSPNRLTEIVSSSGGVLGVSTSGSGSSILYGRIAMYSTAGSNSYIDYGGEIRSYSGAGIDYSDLRFYTAGGSTSAERMRITSSGAVGIGVTLPNTQFHVAGSATINDVVYLQRASSSLFLPVMNYWNGSGQPLNGTKGDIVAIGNAGGDGVIIANANAEVLRITSGNALQLSGNSTTFSIGSISGRNRIQWDSTEFAFFNTANGYTAIGASAFNTRSDYRLKENVAPVQDALSKITSLKPCTFNFIAEPEKEVVGFIAHEVQEVFAQAISGEKDGFRIEQVEVSPAELDEEGNVITEAVIEEKEVPVYQGIDHSKLVPLLVAAIQEQQEQIKSLTEQVEALKSQING